MCKVLDLKKTTIEYEAHDRAAGESKYSIKGLFKFSVQAMLSYSDLPLKIASLCGTFAGIACVLLIIYSIYMKIRVGAPGGYTTTVVVICFYVYSIILLVGDYWRISGSYFIRNKKETNLLSKGCGKLWKRSGKREWGYLKNLKEKYNELVNAERDSK